MKIASSDPDLETLVGRITKKVLDLQPDFQRGEVWGNQKKLRLIDTVLRGWHIPPIHIVSDPETGKFEVLDGQQRLSAIRDFFKNQLQVSGEILPESPEIAVLAGLTYAQLPSNVRERINQYSIRTLTISEHTPEEAGELFYRLNQPTNLTAAEQRNAFFGPARTQVKSIITKFPKWNLTQSTLGFGNSRMAYDDVVARAAFYLNRGTLRHKVTASSVSLIYRSADAFSKEAMSRIEKALQLLGRLIRPGETLKLNKATLLTWTVWLCDVTWCLDLDEDKLSNFIYAFEGERIGTKGTDGAASAGGPASFSRPLLALFSDRASSRVADVSSVLTRHAVLWLEYMRFAKVQARDVTDAGLLLLIKHESRISSRRDPKTAEQALNKVIEDETWGAL